MKTSTTISISEARKKIFDIADEIQQPDVYYTLTENGRPKAVMLSADDFESLLETLEVIKDFPDIDKVIAQTEREIRSGSYKKYVTIEELLAREGFVPAKQAKTAYAVRGKVKFRSRKKFK